MLKELEKAQGQQKEAPLRELRNEGMMLPMGASHEGGHGALKQLDKLKQAEACGKYLLCRSQRVLNEGTIKAPSELEGAQSLKEFKGA